jgi:hypothetical protein
MPLIAGRRERVRQHAETFLLALRAWADAFPVDAAWDGRTGRAGFFYCGDAAGRLAAIVPAKTAFLMFMFLPACMYRLPSGVPFHPARFRRTA